MPKEESGKSRSAVTSQPQTPSETAVPFVKVYDTILDSSIWINETAPTKVVWITMLAMGAAARGFVMASVGGLAHRAGVSREECVEALDVFLSPDPDSRSPEHEGRRIEKVAGGWRILNHGTYRERQTYLDPHSGNTVDCYVYYAVDGHEVKIGTSKNPWARCSELRTARPGISIAVVERGGRELERQRQEQFAGYRLEREWFALSPELQAHIESLQPRPTTPPTTVGAPVATNELPEGERELERETTSRVVGAGAKDSPQTYPQNEQSDDAIAAALCKGAIPMFPDDPVRQHKDDSTRARELVVALNLGLRDNDRIGVHFIPVVATSGTNLLAAEAIAEQGIDHDWAVRATYVLAKRFKVAKRGDSIGSLAWIVPRLGRPWEQHRAKLDVEGATRPEEVEIEGVNVFTAKGGVDAADGQGGANSDGAELTRRNGHRDVKGEGLIIFGRIRAAIAERTLLNNPEDPGAGNRLQRAIDPAILGELSPAAQTALGAIGGARKVARMEEKELASCPWQFAAAYAAAVNSGESTDRKPPSTEKVQ